MGKTKEGMMMMVKENLSKDRKLRVTTNRTNKTEELNTKLVTNHASIATHPLAPNIIKAWVGMLMFMYVCRVAFLLWRRESERFRLKI